MLQQHLEAGDGLQLVQAEHPAHAVTLPARRAARHDGGPEATGLPQTRLVRIVYDYDEHPH